MKFFLVNNTNLPHSYRFCNYIDLNILYRQYPDKMAFAIATQLGCSRRRWQNNFAQSCCSKHGQPNCNLRTVVKHARAIFAVAHTGSEREDPVHMEESVGNKTASPESILGIPETKIYAPRQVRGGGRKRIGYVRKQGTRYVKLPPNPPGLHVSAGTAKGRLIKSPNVYLRPMMGKVREALFSMIGGLGVVRSDACILDLFCGSGSLGIEGLSRGMGSAVFVDFAPECIKTTEENLTNCGFLSRGQAVCSRVEDFIPNGNAYNNAKHYDLITITPPYQEVNYAQLLQSLIESDCIGEGTFVIVEYPVELKTLPPTIGYRLVGVRNRRYGRTVLGVYACQPDVNIDLRPEEFTPLKRHKRR